MLTKITDGLHTITTPLVFLGMHLGTRMTVVTLPDRSLLVHSPIAPTPELRKEIDALGEVSTIVAPNHYHNLFAGTFHDAYPRARLVGPRELAKKRPDLRFAAHFGDAGALPDGVVGMPVPSMLHETVLHVPHLRTLVSADLVENFETSDHMPTRMYLKVSGIHGKPGLAKPLWPMFLDRRAARAAIDRILELDFDRLTLAHGAIIERNARDVVRATYPFLGR